MSLRVDLTGNSTGFQQMLNTAKTQAKAFANSVTHEVGSSWGGIGKQLAGAFAGMISYQGMKSGLDWFIETGKEIKETAEQVDMSTDSWQKWTSAVSKAGLSVGGFQRVLESLRAKRTEALSDPKARGELSRLGFSDEDITGNMDMSEFTKRALSNAGKGDQQRRYLADIIGNRGLKYATATQYYDSSEPLFDKRDLDESHELAMLQKKIGKISGKATVGLMKFFTGDEAYQAKVGAFWKGTMAKYLGGYSNHDVAEYAQENFRAHGGEYEPVKPLRTPDQAREDKAQKAAEDQAAASNATAALRAANARKVEKDPMDAKLAQQREQLALHQQERQQRLMDSERGLMTIGDRRASILNELPKLKDQIADRNANMVGEKFLTQAQLAELKGVTGKAREYSVNALRVKYQDETDTLQMRLNRQTAELKEKPLNFSVDSMAKTGLYSASNVAFNPLLGVQQKQLNVQEKILAKLGGGQHPTPDPYQP
ncbi:MAG: hypothetical protein WCH99_08910 [Verrucomicrobiota bacterium]